MKHPSAPPSNDRDADHAWLERAREEFEAAVRDLDAPARSRLNRARQAALAELDARRPRRAWWAGGALAAAASLAMALAVWREPAPPAMLPAGPAAAQDLDLIAAGDSLELYEDLEFYAWLEQAQQSADG